VPVTPVMKIPAMMLRVVMEMGSVMAGRSLAG
jgi:hypothetical protein